MSVDLDLRLAAMVHSGPNRISNKNPGNSPGTQSTR